MLWGGGDDAHDDGDLVAWLARQSGLGLPSVREGCSVSRTSVWVA